MPDDLPRLVANSGASTARCGRSAAAGPRCFQRLGGLPTSLDVMSVP
jgi:hypothetical protein